MYDSLKGIYNSLRLILLNINFVWRPSSLSELTHRKSSINKNGVADCQMVL